MLGPALARRASASLRSLSTLPASVAAAESKEALFARLGAAADAAAAPSSIAGVAPRAVDSVAVIGAGTMGGGIAMCMAEKGVRTTLVDRNPEVLERGIATLTANWERSASRGKISPEALAAMKACMTGSTDVGDVGEADLVVEAIYENLDAKHAVWSAVDAVAKPDATLATNTSTLDIDKVFATVAASRKPNVCGMHFFSPANVMPLLETVKSSTASPETLATAMGFGRQLGKVTVLAGNCFGFIGNRMVENYAREAMFMLEEGALPHEIDAACVDFGFAMGPCAMSDLAGLDIGHAVRLEAGLVDPATRPAATGRYGGAIADALVERGRCGQKTKKGFYDYSNGRAPERDPEVERLIVEQSHALGIARRAVGAEEIIERCVYSLVNEGYKILDDGIAAAPGDIDVVYFYGYGMRARQPMAYAKAVGEDVVAAKIRGFAEKMPDVPHWELAKGLGGV